jgi:radical SAM superfamily enzyme YgiQ (UPF0313 family)
MMEYDVQLINAPLDAGYMKASRTGNYPPPGIVALASYLLDRSPQLNIELLDGELCDLTALCRKISARIVGISCNVMTYGSALVLAKAASEAGARVILGGPYPSSMPAAILKNRAFVDAVVVGDGEMALHDYVLGKPYRDIPNLCYRGPFGVIENPQATMDLETLPLPNYLNLPLDAYFQNFEQRYGAFKPFTRSLPIYSRKGCVWRDASRGGCVFCMIPHRGVRYKSPGRCWAEIEFLERECGVNFFWEVCDTFTENSHWIDDFVAAKPARSCARFHVYARANNISRHMARQLKRLGVYEVFIGAESGDDGLLVAANKGTTTDQVRKAVELLAEQDIQVILSFVLGLPGETPQTLRKTVDFARELYCYGNIVETSTSLLLPIPGSTAFENLIAMPGMARKYAGDQLDLEELKRDWIRCFTRTHPSELQQALAETWRMFPLNNTFWQRNAASAPMC